MKRIFCGISIFTALFSYAQEKESAIGEVIIYDKILQIPYQDVNGNVLVISKIEIEKSSARSIDELLQQVSGMDVRRRGSNGVQSDVSFRGGNFEQVMILINGIRMNDSQTGHNSMNIPVDLSNIERIEIVKGAAARRFGNNAYSGVINIVTKTSAEENVRVSAEGGDFATYRLGLSSHFGTEKISHNLSINSGESEGYRHNTDYKIRNIFYQNSANIKNGKIGFQAGFSEKKFGANGFYASPLATEQYEETQASIVSVNHQQKFGKFGLNSNIYWRRGQDMYVYNRQNPSLYRNMHIGNNVGGEINSSYQSAVGTTGFGVEMRKEFLASSNLGDRNRFLAQLFLEHHFSFLQNRLEISPGISWANYSNAGNFFYPGIDAGFKINENHKIFGNAAKVNRIPTFTDLYYVSKTEQGNPNLKPESAVSYELGYRFNKKSTTFKASYFGRETDNAIDWTKPNASAIWMAENIGSISTKGFETEISQKFLKNIFKVDAAYTYIDNQFTKTQNFSRYALDNLKHQFTAKLQTQIWKFTNELAYRYNERVNLGSFNILDTKLNFQHKNLNIYTLINNLTNTKYSETFGVPMPGRWFHLGFTYDIKY